MAEPNFFLVGAPKCGTTSLSRYLRQHPQIFVSWYKEPHFFATDLQAAKYIRSERQYLELFRGSDAFPCRGEASTWYLYSARAAREIHAFDPDARIIIMLRNPVDVAYSMHSHNLYVGNENLADFGEALDAQHDRREGRRVPQGATHVATLLYSEIGKFSDQVSRFLDVFGRNQVHVIIFDDFARDTATAYRDTLRFLGVDDGFAPDFRIENASRRARSPVLRDVIRHPVVQRTGRALLPLWAGERMARSLRALNTRQEARPPLHPQLRARLQEEYVADVTRLGDIVERDLSGWIESN